MSLIKKLDFKKFVILALLFLLGLYIFKERYFYVLESGLLRVNKFTDTVTYYSKDEHKWIKL